jgi:hypothetical protein
MFVAIFYEFRTRFTNLKRKTAANINNDKQKAVAGVTTRTSHKSA